MDQDERLVSIFKTDDPGVLPLATMALDAEGIAYTVHNQGKVDSLEWVMSQPPTIRPVVLEILVTSDVAVKARDLVVDLERDMRGASPLDPAALATSADSPTARLEDAASGIVIGAITEAQLQELSSHLEEDQPRHYFVDASTIEMLESANADAVLVSLLRQAVGTGDGLMVRWTV